MSQEGGSSSPTSDVSSVVDSLRNLPLAERLRVLRGDFSRELTITLSQKFVELIDFSNERDFSRALNRHGEVASDKILKVLEL